ncbi:MAG: hypothetical protein EBZ69_09435 [Alphaproteobacteria bacterium]|nr:hypothetical protein [Alphaproteobacteria bacterium]
MLPSVFVALVAETLPVATSDPTVKLPARLMLPSVTVRYAGDTNGVDLAAGRAIALVCTWFPVAVSAITAKRDNSGLHVRRLFVVFAKVARVVHVTPSDDDITKHGLPLDTVTKRDNSGLQTKL